MLLGEASRHGGGHSHSHREAWQAACRGEGASKYHKALFLVFVFLGSVITSANVLNFGDLMILGMAFPNLIGVYFLHGKVRHAMNEYWARYKSGGMPVYK